MGAMCANPWKALYDSSFRKTILVPFFYDNIIMGAYLRFRYAYPEI